MQNKNTALIGDLFNKSLHQVNVNQAAKRRAKWKPEFSRFKLKFYYRDGNESVHYSYDMYHRYQDGVKIRETDEATGLTKLLRCIEKQTANDSFISAVIWTKLSQDTSTSVDNYHFEVYRFVRKKQVQACKHLHFENGRLRWELLTRFADQRQAY